MNVLYLTVDSELHGYFSVESRLPGYPPDIFLQVLSMLTLVVWVDFAAAFVFLFVYLSVFRVISQKPMQI